MITRIYLFFQSLLVRKYFATFGERSIAVNINIEREFDAIRIENKRKEKKETNERNAARICENAPRGQSSVLTQHFLFNLHLDIFLVFILASAYLFFVTLVEIF